MSSLFVILNPREDKLDLNPSLPALTSPKDRDPFQLPLQKVALMEENEPATYLNADFIITCNGLKFLAHRSLLAAQCSYFQGMFRFNGTVRTLPFAPPHYTAVEHV